MTSQSDHPILLFDGFCNLCQGWIKFVLPRDDGEFRFASLQSKQGENLLRKSGITPGSIDSVVLLDEDGTHVRSTAALRVLRRLGFPWSLLFVFIIVPPPLRNWAYDFIARNRYRWWGRSEACMVPAKSVEDRFLDSKPGPHPNQEPVS